MRFIFTGVTLGWREGITLLFDAKLWGPTEKSRKEVGRELTFIKQQLHSRRCTRFQISESFSDLRLIYLFNFYNIIICCDVLCLASKSYLTHCNSMDCSLPGSPVQKDSLGKNLEWVTMPSSRGSSWPRDWTQVACIACGFFTIWATRETQEYWSG